jgi:TetR/AcrR family transcriptional regulator
VSARGFERKAHMSLRYQKEVPVMQHRSTVVKQPIATALSRRGKGRPSRTDVGVGREGLIDATRELLRTIPPGKLTRQHIAEFAKVNPALIRYYFGDTSTLLTAVVESIHHENLNRLREVLREPGTAIDKLRRRVRLILQMHLEYPYYHQLIFEQLWQGEREDQKRVGKDMVSPYYSEFKELVLEGRRQGEFRDVDTRFLHVATLSLCELFINAPYLLQHLFKMNSITPQLVQKYGDFVVDLLIHGIGTVDR